MMRNSLAILFSVGGVVSVNAEVTRSPVAIFSASVLWALLGIWIWGTMMWKKPSMTRITRPTILVVLAVASAICQLFVVLRDRPLSKEGTKMDHTVAPMWAAAALTMLLFTLALTNATGAGGLLASTTISTPSSTPAAPRTAAVASGPPGSANDQFYWLAGMTKYIINQFEPTSTNIATLDTHYQDYAAQPNDPGRQNQLYSTIHTSLRALCPGLPPTLIPQPTPANPLTEKSIHDAMNRVFDHISTHCRGA